MQKKIYHIPQIEILHIFMQEVMKIDNPSDATGSLPGPGSKTAPERRTDVF